MRTAGLFCVVVCSMAIAADTTQSLVNSITQISPADSAICKDTTVEVIDTLLNRNVPTDTLPFVYSSPQLNDSITQDSIKKVAAIVALPAGDTTVRVAVIAFIGRGVDSGFVSGFSDRFRILFSNICPLQVVGPLQIDHRLDSVHWQGENPCDHNECFVAMGRALGVRYIIGGSVGVVGDLFTFALRMIDVESEKVVCFRMVDAQKEIPGILYQVLPALAVEFNNKLVVPHTAMASIKSEPSGATVMLDESPIGSTPLIIKNISAGQHTVSLQKTPYLDTAESISFSPGMWTAKRYPLSIAKEQKEQQQSRYRMVWVVRGAGVLGSIAALSFGLHYNTAVNNAADEQQSIVNEYKKAGTGKNGTLFVERYNHQEHLFRTWSAYRNLCYAASVILVGGVSVSFVF